MIYYILGREVEPKIVGVTDGAGQYHILLGDFLERNSWYKSIFHKTELTGKDWWKSWANITQYAQPLHEVFMEKKSKHTDYMCTSGFMRGFVVNNKLREI